MHPENQAEVLKLVEEVRRRLPDKTIWCYTGYDFETDILGDMVNNIPQTRRILECLDVLVDGKFVEEKKDLKLRFKGSSNQRIIKVPDSLAHEKVILWE